MKIVLDCHGGDLCPQAAVEGALEALVCRASLQIVLCGKQEEIQAVLQGKEYDTARVEILDADEVITNDDVPTTAIRRKKNSSMVRALRAVADAQADGIVSSGNTGALLVGASVIVKLIDGVTRACLSAVVPLAKGGNAVVVDAGANVDCRANMLLEFAVMGDAFMRTVYETSLPRVGLLSNGAESEKGNALTKEAHELLGQSKLNFVGNVEARYLMNGVCDVIVTDGFAGNMVIKASEGMALSLFGMIKDNIMEGGLRAKLGYLMLKPALRKVKRALSSDEVGGGAFLGARGVVVKAHGASGATAFRNAILLADSMAERNLVGKIKSGLADHSAQPQA